MKTLLQPKSGIKAAAARPPPAAPRVKPQNMTLTRKPRRLAGAYSESSVVALGIAAPSPTPVKNRRTIRLLSEVA